MNKLLLLPLIILLAGCSFFSKEQSTTVYLDDGNILHYRGELSKEANQKAFHLYSKSSKKPKILSISSGGGRVTLGMELGHWVFDNNMSVIVNEICYSSCANYIFTAGKIKYLSKNSILGWHGGMSSTSFIWPKNFSEAGKAEVLAELSLVNEKEIAFFNKINVNQKITTYGQLYNENYKHEGYQGYNYSLEDLEKFGVVNVELIAKKWNWEEANNKAKTKRISVNTDNL